MTRNCSHYVFFIYYVKEYTFILLMFVSMFQHFAQETLDVSQLGFASVLELVKCVPHMISVKHWESTYTMRAKGES